MKRKPKTATYTYKELAVIFWAFINKSAKIQTELRLHVHTITRNRIIQKYNKLKEEWTSCVHCQVRDIVHCKEKTGRVNFVKGPLTINVMFQKERLHCPEGGVYDGLLQNYSPEYQGHRECVGKRGI